MSRSSTLPSTSSSRSCVSRAASASISPAASFSAAAVAASGLLDLARQTGDARYRQAALETLDELATRDVAPTGPALLAHAVGGKPQDSEVDVGMVYADFYFLEAVSRAS